MEFTCHVNGEFQKYIKSFLRDSFFLVDIGCAGGIDQAWMGVFSEKLCAYGIDSNVEEIKRLLDQNTNVHYMCATIRTFLDHQKKETLWARTSAHKAHQIACSSLHHFSDQEIVDNNLYKYREISQKEIILADFINEECADLDFIKIDVDGPDLDILKSVKEQIISKNTLGVVIEINYEGQLNRFSEVDDFLQSCGLEIFDITKRYYDSRYLPGRFQYAITAQTVKGRIVQGDALYLRDPCKAFLSHKMLSFPKLIKLLIMYDMFHMSSWAAEILVHFKSMFEEEGMDVEHALNLLAVESYTKNALDFENFQNTYASYTEQFMKDYPSFFPKKEEVIVKKEEVIVEPKDNRYLDIKRNIKKFKDRIMEKAVL